MEPPLTCPFCNPVADEIVAKNDLCYARWDRYPVSKGHLLVIPLWHIPDFLSHRKSRIDFSQDRVCRQRRPGSDAMELGVLTFIDAIYRASVGGTKK